jgi:hypothetical protein
MTPAHAVDLMVRTSPKQMADPGVHRRLQRALRTVPLDQDRRRDPHQSQPSKELRHATLAHRQHGASPVP